MTDEAAAAALAAGEVLLLATDTICGLHARADNSAALARMLALKGRRPEQPFLVLAASLEQALAMCRPLPDASGRVCRAAWPGPFTFILPAADGLADLVCDRARGTVAVRVPARADLRRLIGQAGGALASTSANETGQPPLVTLTEAVAAYGDRVGGWWAGLEGAVGPESARGGRPSALVDLTIHPPRILRQGPVALPEGA